MKIISASECAFWFAIGFALMALIIVLLAGCIESPDLPVVEQQEQQEQVEPQEEIEPDGPDMSVDIGQGSIDIRYPGGKVELKRRLR